MYFSTAIIAALAAAQAAFAVPVSDPHELDFRSFGAPGCYAKNQGVYTLELSMSGKCNPFSDDIGSLLVSDNLCTLTVYSDTACSVAPKVLPTSVCQNGTWESYKMTC